MVIINEKDEQNPKNSRTIDTDTGVFLEKTGYRGNEALVFFEVTDGDFSFRFETELEFRDTDSGEKLGFYKLHNVYPSVGRKYMDIVRNLLKVFNTSYGPVGRVHYEYEVDFSKVKQLFVSEGEDQ